jgi:hypothetical protein
MPENSSENLNLLQLLERQKELYTQALSLEEQMSEAAEKADFQLIREINSKKAEHISETNRAFEQLNPLLQDCKDEKGEIPDKDAEALRLELKALLSRIEEVQQKNYDLISGMKSKALGDLKGTELARKVAKGYRPSREGIKSRYDTRR